MFFIFGVVRRLEFFCIVSSYHIDQENDEPKTAEDKNNSSLKEIRKAGMSYFKIKYSLHFLL